MVLKALLYVLYPPFKVAKRLMCSLGDSAAVLPEGAVEPVAEAKVGMPAVQLSTGARMPKVAFGTWQIPRKDTKLAVKAAIAAGYRHIDGAWIYGNEIEVGQGIREAIREGLVTRGELFVTSKLWVHSFDTREVERACRDTLDDLFGPSDSEDKYLDLYLVHQPFEMASGRIVGTFDAAKTWPGMEGCVAKGLARAVGVSNFNVELLDETIATAAEHRPCVNQVEVHPGNRNDALRAACAERGVVVEAYAPLGTSSMLGDAVVGRVAKRRGVTPAQAMLAWGLKRGDVVLPKSRDIGRLRDNLRSLSVELTEEDMAELATVKQTRLFTPFPPRWSSVPEYFGDEQTQ